MEQFRTGVSGIFGRDGAVSGVLLGVVVCLGVEAALTRHGRAAHRDTGAERPPERANRWKPPGT